LREQWANPMLARTVGLTPCLREQWGKSPQVEGYAGAKMGRPLPLCGTSSDI